MKHLAIFAFLIITSSGSAQYNYSLITEERSAETFSYDMDDDNGFVFAGDYFSKRIFIYQKDADSVKQYQILEPPWGYMDNSNFGISLAVDYPYMAATSYDSLSRLLIYKHIDTVWILHQDIISPLWPEYKFMGSDIDMEDGWLITGGNPYHPEGVMLIFNNESGSYQLEQIIKENLEPSDHFASAVEINDGRIFIGTSSQTVYVYKNDAGTWALQQKIRHRNNEPNFAFGYTIAADSTFLMINAPGNEFGYGADKINVYELSDSLYQLRNVIETDTYSQARFDYKDNLLVVANRNYTDEMVEFYYNTPFGFKKVHTQKQILNLDQMYMYVTTPNKTLITEENIFAGFSSTEFSCVGGRGFIVNFPYVPHDFRPKLFISNAANTYVYPSASSIKVNFWNELTSTLSLYYSVDGGSNWSPVATEIMTSSVELSFELPDIISNNFYIKIVSNNDNSIVDSTGPFVLWKDISDINVNKIEMPGLINDSRFGGSVELYDNYLYASTAALKGETSNSVIVYEYNEGWNRTEKIKAPHASIGGEITAKNGLLFLGAPSELFGTSSGAVYVYKITDTGHIFMQRLKASDAIYNDNFGNAIDYDGNTLIIGNSNRNSGTGNAYVFERKNSEFIETQILLPQSDTTGGAFGNSVAVDGEFMAVGAVFEEGLNQGAVYLYKYNGVSWDLFTRLTLYDIDDFCFYGSHVEIENAELFVGSNGRKTIYVYELGEDGALLKKELNVMSDESGLYLSQDFDVDGDLMITRTQVSNNAELQGGAAYIFHRVNDEWYSGALLHPSILHNDSRFGESVAINRQFCVAGAYFFSAPGISRSGAVFAYDNFTDLLIADPGDKDTDLPDIYQLDQNYPNPFNPYTTISYQIKSVSEVRLRIYNITGELVAELVNNTQVQGNYSLTWDASGLASGIYFCELQAKDIENRRIFHCVKKMMLIK